MIIFCNIEVYFKRYRLSRKVNELEDFKKDLNVKNKNLKEEVIDMKKEKKELENKISKTR